MKKMSLKFATGLTLTFATSAFCQNGLAEVVPTYRNMNIPVAACTISAESKKHGLETGAGSIEQLDLVIDFEAALLLNQGNLKAKAMIVYKDEKPDVVSGTTLNSVLTGNVSKNSKSKDLTFTSDEIKYSQSFVGNTIVAFSVKNKTAKVSFKSADGKNDGDESTYNCTGGLVEE